MKTEENSKPIKAKPHFYSVCLEGLQAISKDLGYNLVIHGSMNRDMDLVAIPWVDDPHSHKELLLAFCEYLGVPYLTNTEDVPCHYTMLAGGRSSYVINLNRGGKFNGYLDATYYLDISITPLLSQFQNVKSDAPDFLNWANIMGYFRLQENGWITAKNKEEPITTTDLYALFLESEKNANL